MAGEVIVEVTPYAAPLAGELGHDAGPELELARTIDLRAGVIHDLSVGSHPPYVAEVRRGTLGERHHRLAGNPARIGERERDVVLRQQRDHAVVNPALVAKLHREGDVLR